MARFCLRKTGQGDLLFQGDFDHIKETVEAAVNQGVCLDYVDLRGANLMNANLDEGHFNHARFDHANLTGANLCGAQLQSTRFLNATLYNTYLCEANLTGAQFFGSSFGGVDIAWADIKDTCFDTMTALDLNFSHSLIMKGAMFYDPTGVTCEMSHAPIVIKGLEYPIVLFDNHMKVGAAVMSFDAWSDLKNNLNCSSLDHDMMMFIKVYGSFLFTLAQVRPNKSKNIQANVYKNVG